MTTKIRRITSMRPEEMVIQSRLQTEDILAITDPLETSVATYGSHIDDTSNPHSVTKSQVGLGNVPNFPLSDQTTAETGTSNTVLMSALGTSQQITARLASDANAIDMTNNTKLLTPYSGKKNFIENYKGLNLYPCPNRIINSALIVDQFGKNAACSIIADGRYIQCGDRFYTQKAGYSYASTAQVVDATITGSPLFKALKITMPANVESPAPTACHYIRIPVAKEMTKDLLWGTANAASIDIGFWVNSSVAGTFSYIVSNANDSYGYGVTYTINSANTWEYKTATIPGFTSANTPSEVMEFKIFIDLGAGSTSSIPSAGSWTPGTYTKVSSTVNLTQNANATFQIAGMSVVPSGLDTKQYNFDYPSEINRCYRYSFRKTSSYAFAFPIQDGSTNYRFVLVEPPVELIYVPTSGFTSVSFCPIMTAGKNSGNFINGAPIIDQASTTMFVLRLDVDTNTFCWLTDFMYVSTK